MANETRDESFGRWRNLSTAVIANAADLPHLVNHAQRLTVVLNETESAVTEQAVRIASKQEMSQEIDDHMVLGRRLAAFLSAGVRERYGNRAEKLAEFKMQPLRRGKPRIVETPAPEIAETGLETETATDQKS